MLSGVPLSSVEDAMMKFAWITLVSVAGLSALRRRPSRCGRGDLARVDMRWQPDPMGEWIGGSMADRPAKEAAQGDWYRRGGVGVIDGAVVVIEWL